VSALGGHEQVELLTVTNPGRVLADERPLPVTPLPAALEELLG